MVSAFMALAWAARRTAGLMAKLAPDVSLAGDLRCDVCSGDKRSSLTQGHCSHTMKSMAIIGLLVWGAYVSQAVARGK